MIITKYSMGTMGRVMDFNPVKLWIYSLNRLIFTSLHDVFLGKTFLNLDKNSETLLKWVCFANLNKMTVAL